MLPFDPEDVNDSAADRRAKERGSTLVRPAGHVEAVRRDNPARAILLYSQAHPRRRAALEVVAELWDDIAPVLLEGHGWTEEVFPRGWDWILTQVEYEVRALALGVQLCDMGDDARVEELSNVAFRTGELLHAARAALKADGRAEARALAEVLEPWTPQEGEARETSLAHRFDAAFLPEDWGTEDNDEDGGGGGHDEPGGDGPGASEAAVGTLAHA